MAPSHIKDYSVCMRKENPDRNCFIIFIYISFRRSISSNTVCVCVCKTHTHTHSIERVRARERECERESRRSTWYNNLVWAGGLVHLNGLWIWACRQTATGWQRHQSTRPGVQGSLHTEQNNSGPTQGGKSPVFIEHGVERTELCSSDPPFSFQSPVKEWWIVPTLTA